MNLKIRESSARKIAKAARAYVGEHVKYMTVCADMWDWLADHPDKEKRDYPIPKESRRFLTGASCPACNAVDARCCWCPLATLWGTESLACMGAERSPYAKWVAAGRV